MTQGSNPGLPYCREMLYRLSHQGSPRILEWVAHPFSSRSSWPRNWTGVSCIAGRFFTYWAIRIEKEWRHKSSEAWSKKGKPNEDHETELTANKWAVPLFCSLAESLLLWGHWRSLTDQVLEWGPEGHPPSQCCSVPGLSHLQQGRTVYWPKS